MLVIFQVICYSGRKLVFRTAGSKFPIKHDRSVTRRLGRHFGATVFTTSEEILKFLVCLLSFHPIRNSWILHNYAFLTTQSWPSRRVRRNHSPLRDRLQNSSLKILFGHLLGHRLRIILGLKLFGHLPLNELDPLDGFDCTLMILHKFPALHKRIVPIRMLTRFENGIFDLTWNSNLFVWNPVSQGSLRHWKNHFLKIILREVLFRISIHHCCLVLTLEFMSAITILGENLCSWDELIHLRRKIVGCNLGHICHSRRRLLGYVPLKRRCIIFVLCEYIGNIWQFLLLLLL